MNRLAIWLIFCHGCGERVYCFKYFKLASEPLLLVVHPSLPLILIRQLMALSLSVLGGLAVAQQQALPLPKLPDGVIELRVAYVRNPRLPEMSDAQLHTLMEIARLGVREHFGRDIQFTTPARLSVQELFQRFAAVDAKILHRGIYDFKSGRGDDARLRKAYVQGIGRYKDNLDDQINYVRPYLLAPLTGRSYEALSDALMQTHLARLRQFAAQRMADGGLLIDDKPYNEYAYWGSLDFVRAPFEVVVTNQLIASAEYYDPEVHSAIRGGISNGITAQNGDAHFGSTSVVSTYPFIGDDATTKELRGNESYSGDDAAKYAGYMLAHELGHQLLHLGHPYGRKACVMNPAELLHFRAWVNQFSAKDCPIAASGAMMPGFVKLPVPRAMNQ